MSARKVRLKRIKRKIKWRNYKKQKEDCTTRTEYINQYHQNRPKTYHFVDGVLVEKVPRPMKEPAKTQAKQVTLSEEETLERRKQKYLSKIRTRLKYANYGKTL